MSAAVIKSFETAKDLHNGNLDPCIKYSSLTALMTEAVGAATPSFRPNNRKQRPTDLTPPRKQPPPCPWWNAECDKQPSGSSSVGVQGTVLLTTRKQKPKLEMG
jgi:hypothetical protein